MDCEWINRLQSDIEAETPLHKSSPTSVKVRTVVFGSRGNPKWGELDDLELADGMLDVDAAIVAGKAACANRSRFVAACLISFDLDHEEILEGHDECLVTTDLSAGGKVKVPEVIPRFHDLTEIVLFFRAVELVPTRRVGRARAERRAKTRRCTNGLKPPI